jgi:cytochrome c-550 PedF
MKHPRIVRLSLAALLAAAAGFAFAHGDVIPQPVDTGNLPKLGETWKDTNPYSGNPEAIKIGKMAFAENCARCHGIDAVSGGIAPDLRQLPLGEDGDALFKQRIQNGSIRNGVTYMPPFGKVFTQEAAWAIRSWIETRHQD